jgi:hypothetical protein
MLRVRRRRRELAALGIPLALLGIASAGIAARAQEATAVDPHAGHIAIRVRRAGDERPAADVEVRVLDAADHTWVGDLGGFGTGLDLVQGFLPPTRTDEQGLAWVPEPNGSFSVIASEAGWFGMSGGVIRQPGETTDVSLAPDPLLRVRVLDAQHRAAAGVDVALLVQRSPDLEPVLPAALVYTNAEGIAELHPGRFGGAGRLFVLASAWDPASELRELDLARLPLEPLEVVLGPTGALEVTLLDASGTLVDMAGVASLEPASQSLDRAREALRRDVVAPLEHGLTRFVHVPVGVDFAVRLHPRGAVVEGTGKLVRLEKAGETRTLSFAATRVSCGVRARLRDSAGELLVTTPVVLSWSGSWRDTRALTNAQGVVSSWAHFLDESAQEITLDVATLVPYRAPLGGTARFRVAGSKLVELGDVTLTPRPLLASGIVVDSSGAPFPRAEVLAVETPDPAGGGNRIPRKELACATDAVGRFALLGAVDGEIVVEARHGSAIAPASVTVEPGRSDVRLVLERTGSLETTVLLDPGVPSVVRVNVVDPSGRGGNRESSLPSPQGFRRLHADFAPGDYTVSCRWGATTLAEVPDVRVRAGEVTRDPRCNPIDLRGRFRTIDLEVRGPADAAGYCTVDVQEHGGVGSNSGAASARIGEHTKFYVLWPAVDLVLRADGFRTARVENVTDSASVTLEPGPLVRFVLDDASRAWLGERELTLQVVREGAGGQPSLVRMVDGRGELRIGEPGRFVIHLELRERPAGETPRTSHGTLPPVEIGAGDEQELMLHPELARFMSSG